MKRIAIIELWPAHSELFRSLCYYINYEYMNKNINYNINEIVKIDIYYEKGTCVNNNSIDICKSTFTNVDFYNYKSLMNNIQNNHTEKNNNIFKYYDLYIFNSANSYNLVSMFQALCGINLKELINISKIFICHEPFNNNEYLLNKNSIILVLHKGLLKAFQKDIHNYEYNNYNINSYDINNIKLFHNIYPELTISCNNLNSLQINIGIIGAISYQRRNYNYLLDHLELFLKQISMLDKQKNISIHLNFIGNCISAGHQDYVKLYNQIKTRNILQYFTFYLNLNDIEFNKHVSNLDYVLLLPGNEFYKTRFTGSISNAISFEIPIIYHESFNLNDLNYLKNQISYKELNKIFINIYNENVYNYSSIKRYIQEQKNILIEVNKKLFNEIIK